MELHRNDWKDKIVLSLHVTSWFGTSGYVVSAATKAKKYQQKQQFVILFPDQPLVRGFPGAEVVEFQV